MAARAGQPRVFTSRFNYREPFRFYVWHVPAGKWISLAIAAATIVGAAIASPRWKMTALLAATILPTLFLLMISNGGMQCGAFYMPLAVSIAPGVLGRLLSAETALT